MPPKNANSNKPKVQLKTQKSQRPKSAAPQPRLMSRPSSSPVYVKKKKMGVHRIKGKGDYFTDIVDWGKKAYNVIDKGEESKGVINKGARAIGEMIGSKVGLGRQAGNIASYISRIFGHGDYQISNNAFLGSSPPTFSDGKGEDMVVVRREYLRDITSSNEFRTTKLMINPGNPEVFPWLSGIASKFEEYQFEGLVFEFKSMASDAISVGGGMGTVIMATDYDVYDENYADKRAMEQSEFSNSSIISKTFVHPIECDPSRNVMRRMYICPGATTIAEITGDARLCVQGVTTIATQGCPVESNATSLGELWVSYKVKLSRPIYESQQSHGIYTQNFSGITSANSLSSTTTLQRKGVVGPEIFKLKEVFGSGTSQYMEFNTSYKIPATYIVTYTGYYFGVGNTTFYAPANPVPYTTGGLEIVNCANNGSNDTKLAFVSAAYDTNGYTATTPGFSTRLVIQYKPLVGIETGILRIPVLMSNGTAAIVWNVSFSPYIVPVMKSLSPNSILLQDMQRIKEYLHLRDGKDEESDSETDEELVNKEGKDDVTYVSEHSDPDAIIAKLKEELARRPRASPSPNV